ncbi:MAG: redoxin domain-containing protein [Planctomycetes bacterium]|nr:redoxin domain-containing protein [Planctomycetota bacterium]
MRQLKYILLAVVMLSIAVSVILAAPLLQQCCEYFGLVAPEGVSEVPGVKHVAVVPARPDGTIPEEVPGLKLRQKVENFSLPDLNGKKHQVDFSAKTLTVVVWVSSVCPTSKIYEDRLNKLQAEFGDVAFWAVNSSAMEGVAELREHYLKPTRPDRLRITVLKDDRNIIADRFGAQKCPDIFVFDRDGKLQYRGGVDDSRKPMDVKKQYLREVLKDLLKGETPQWRYTPANGCCPIDRIEEEAPSTK